MSEISTKMVIVNKYKYFCVTLFVFHSLLNVKVTSGRVTMTERNSDNVIKSHHRQSLESLIGDTEIIPKKLISKIENLISPISNNSTELCRNDSEFYIVGLRNGETWAYKMLDSSAKLQSGMLTGNLVSFGSFDECLEVMNVRTDWGSFNGKHCLASFTWGNGSFLSTSKFFNDIKRPGNPNSVTVQWGLCIPSSCNAQDLKTGLKDFLYEDVTVSVTDLDCQTNSEIKLRPIDCAAIAVFFLFGLAVILSTAYDLLRKESRREIFLAFSLVNNGKKLLNTDTSSDLTCLHGIRFLSICWVVLGHRYLISLGGPAINLVFLNQFIKDWSSVLLISGVLAVDTFLLMSGVLIVYVFLRKMGSSQNQRFNIPLYYFQRYIRLTPVLAVLVFLQLSLIQYFGSGPLWDKGNAYMTQLCVENWWSALLYIQNYVSGDRMCVGHSWYLSVDMQLVWISPIILLPLLRWPRKWNFTWLGALILAGTVTSFTITYVNEFPAGVQAGEGPKWAAKNKYEYVKTHARFTPWVIGAALGYILYLNRGSKIKLNKLQVFGGWFIAAVAFLGVMFGIYPFEQADYVYNNMESSFYNSLHRPIWALSLSWVIFACVSGYGGLVNRFLSWKLFLPFSRLTYCIYLVHFMFILNRHFVTRTPIYLSDMNMVSMHFSDIIFSILLAAALCLMFELPAMHILNILLSSDESKRVQNTEEGISRIEEGGNANLGFSTSDDSAVSKN